MMYFLVPILVALVAALVVLTFKAALWLGDRASGVSGFDIDKFNFRNFLVYFTSLFGLFAAEISLGAFIINTFCT